MNKMATGIPGFDDISDGGIPSGRLTLVAGEAGAGKTIFAMQCLVSGVMDFGEPAVFVSFEERADEIAANFATFGWRIIPLSALASEQRPLKSVLLLDANLSPDIVDGGAFDISGILAAVSAAVAATSAKRVVFDGLDVLLDLLDDPHQRRREIARLGEWTRSNAVTVIVTAKQLNDLSTAEHERYGFLRYFVSCVIALKRASRTSSADRVVEILKVRGSNHSSSEHPLIIRETGMIIGDVGSTRLSYQATNEHVSSGIARLDAMLGGGYYRASGILISGAPGTAKSTLAGAFVDAACTRGERSLLISFDEAFSQIERNLASVNIHLNRHVKSGLLASAGFRTGRLNAEEHFHQLMELVEAHQPKILVIDPISALDKVVGQDLAGDLAERLIDEAKVRGITILITSLLGSGSAISESTRVQISSIADTWIQLSFSLLNGERNRALTIIKSRGNAHSNQVRELVLSHRGLDLADVYGRGGEVLMGTARMEQEFSDLAEENRWRRELDHTRSEMELAESRLGAKILELQTELKALERRRGDVLENDAERQLARAFRQKSVMEHRSAGDPTQKRVIEN